MPAKIELNNVLQALTALCEDDREMPVHRALMLLHIALQPGISRKQLQKLTGFGNAAVARNLGILSEYRALGQPGLNLVTEVRDPAGPTSNIIFPTAKGWKRVERVLAKIYGKAIALDGETAANYVKRAHAGEEAQ